MERGNTRFREDSITIEQITKDLACQDEKRFVGKALQKSIESINSLPSDNSEALVLIEIMNLLLDSELIYLGKKFGEKALEASSGINIASEKARTLSRLASTFADHDFLQMSDKIFEDSWEEAKKVEKEEKKIEVFLSIIEDQIEKGLIKKAEKNLDKTLSRAVELTEKKDDLVPLAMVTETMAKIDCERAEDLCSKVLKHAENIKSKDNRGRILGSIAKAFSRMGKHEKSMELMEDLVSSDDYSDIQLVEVTLTLSKEGQIERALYLKDHVKNQELKDSLMGMIAADLVNRKSVKEAIKLKEKIQDEFETDLLLKNLVSHFAKEDRKKARMYLYEIGSREMKALAYLELSLSYLNDEDNEKAKELALEGKKMMDRSKSETVKLEVIETLIEVGFKEKACEVAEEINTSEERAIAYGSIAARCY